MANILITEFMNQKQVEQLSALHNVNYEPELYSNNEAIIENSSDVHALIVRNKTNVDMQLINSMKNLKVIGRLGVGLDNIDVAHCKEKNVPVIVAEDPLTCVARGGGRALEIMDKYDIDLLSTE